MTMVRTVGWAALLLCASGLVAAAPPLGDSSRGERLLETQQCTRCHSINGRGGTTAVDLDRRIGRNLTPALLAGTLWNHAPAMWSEMRRQGIESPVMSTQEVADLFAFFYSARYFDRPGDAGRGKEAFSRHRCAECHGLSESKSNAPAVSAWQSLGSPVALAEAMWNHAREMRTEYARRGYRWPELSPRDLTDIYVYLRNHPSISPPQGSFQVSSTDGGEALMKAKGCLDCHSGPLTLASRVQGKTLNDLASAMWNHNPEMMAKAGAFRPGEMGTLLSYVWASNFFLNSGDAARGKKVFRQKSCAACHQGQTARLAGDFNTMRITSALWNHGPAMMQEMRKRGIRWPRFKDREMEDLIAYLNDNNEAIALGQSLLREVGITREKARIHR
ncbi:MAG: c-type cytochrome [Bryobacteraceae bacterium]|nr:c-type cytochrome [Bryobacteraceae bacterium]